MIHHFFGLSGRTGRLGFWFGMLAIALVGASLTLPAIPSIFSDNPFKAILQNTQKLGLYGLAVSLALFYPAIAVTAKRLHDRNKTGWYTALLWVPLLTKMTTGLFDGLGWLETAYNLSTWLLLEMVAVGIWFFIELGFFSGTAGPNKYGPEPGVDEKVYDV